MSIKLIVTCCGCGKEANEIDLTLDELDDYQADDLSNDLENSLLGDDSDWGIYWNEEDEENKVYCPTCKAYKVK